MEGIVHVSEFATEAPYDFLSFFVCSLLMFFHGQEYEIGVFATFMLCQEIQGFCDQFDVLFVTWDDKCM